MRSAVGLLVLGLFLAALIGPAFAQTAPSDRLTLSVNPPLLPADGNTYNSLVVSLVDSSGNPTTAPSNVSVFLTSSVQAVASVPSEVTIPAGSQYVVASVATSDTPGTTEITASSVGLAPNQIPVTTVVPSGFPTHLNVFGAPSTQVARANGNGSLIVEMTDDTGLPAKAVTATTIRLSSSDTTVASLSASQIVIPAGSMMYVLSYRSSFVTGSATITATAPGFDTGVGSISVVGASPIELKISAMPSSVPKGVEGQYVVSLADSLGNPVTASSNVQVTVTSSNTTVASVEQQITIPAGSIYATGSFSAISRGSAVLSAVSQGLETGFATVTVSAPGTPTALQLYVAPNPVLADGSSYNSVVVALYNAATQAPAIASSAIVVNLTSSSSSIGEVTDFVTIPAGSNYALAEFTSGFAVGQTSVSATAQGLVTAIATVDTYGPIPAHLSLSFLPSTIPADGQTYQSMEVSLQDVNGMPAIAPSQIDVHLTSSQPGVASINTDVIIPQGSSSILVPITSSISAGSTEVTAAAENLNSSSATLTTVTPAPFKIGLYVSPANALITGSPQDAYIAVQLQDAAGMPARARADTPVTITSSNGAVLSHPFNITIPLGADFAVGYVSFTGPGSTTLTASAEGLSSASTQVSATAAAATLAVSANPAQIFMNQTAVITVKLSQMGQGVSGVPVTLSASSGTLLAASGVTNATGVFTTVFQPSALGAAQITAQAVSGVFGARSGSTVVGVVNSIATPPPGRAAWYLTPPYLYIIIVIAVGAGAGVFFAVRTIRKRKDKEAPVDTPSEQPSPPDELE